VKFLTRRTLRNFGISTLIAASALSASPAWALQIFANTPDDGTQVLDVEPSDTIENVKAKLADKIQVLAQDQCLTFNGVLLVNDFIVSDYGISKDDTISMNYLPVLATWSITPDDPFLGREVSNSIHSTLDATGYEILEGALPVGVTLNESSGAITGRFDAAGPFDVTIGATTICGVAEVEWSGTVPGSLPATGTDENRTSSSAILAVLLGLAGAALLVVRRRRARAN
jgi:LPXTG-motif cell wall-anchored protein